ncbi:hypothetical protein AOLI_G00176450 [Acnodon oligacanthus]
MRAAADAYFQDLCGRGWPPPSLISPLPNLMHLAGRPPELHLLSPRSLRGSVNKSSRPRHTYQQLARLTATIKAAIRDKPRSPTVLHRHMCGAWCSRGWGAEVGPVSPVCHLRYSSRKKKTGKRGPGTLTRPSLAHGDLSFRSWVYPSFSRAASRSPKLLKPWISSPAAAQQTQQIYLSRSNAPRLAW